MGSNETGALRCWIWDNLEGWDDWGWFRMICCFWYYIVCWGTTLKGFLHKFTGWSSWTKKRWKSCKTVRTHLKLMNFCKHFVTSWANKNRLRGIWHIQGVKWYEWDGVRIESYGLRWLPVCVMEVMTNNPFWNWRITPEREFPFGALKAYVSEERTCR